MRKFAVSKLKLIRYKSRLLRKVLTTSSSTAFVIFSNDRFESSNKNRLIKLDDLYLFISLFSFRMQYFFRRKPGNMLNSTSSAFSTLKRCFANLGWYYTAAIELHQVGNQEKCI